MRSRTHLLNVLKIVVGLGLLYFLYTRLQDPAALWQQTLAADRWMLLLALLSHALAVALSASKWWLLLRAQHISVPLTRLFAFQWMGIFFDNFFPAQVGGDVLRGYNLARDTHRTADAAASVLIDRFTGLTAFMLAAALSSSAILITGGLPAAASSQELAFLRFIDLRLIALGSSGVAVILLTALALLLSRRTKVLVERILTRLPLGHRVLPVWQKLAEAINAYRHAYPAMAVAGLVSLLIVVVTSVTIWLLANALSPGSINFVQVLVINPIIAFLSVIPLSPGGLGVRQVAFAALFVSVGAGAELGFLVGLLQQMITYLVSLPGLLLWLRGRGEGESSPATPGFPDEPSA
ncbi:MAG: flippase-like domain-containing protein [Caldilineaceae bacterium]|nr:flippase-like domain-containing protein [Caldilineaceae bacterium]